MLPTFFDQTFSANKRETSANVQQILRNCKFKAKGAETERQGMAWRDKIKHNLEITVPAFFTCPISLELMKDPVSTCTGVTYDRSSIEKWIDEGHTTCPATLQQLETMELIPNHTLRRLIQAWCSANASLGVERIPTPKTPANPSNVRSLFEEVGSSSSQDRIVALKRLKSLAKDSVRNAICIADEGGTQVLCGVLSEGSLEEIELAVCVLAVLPLDDPAKKRIGGVSELSALAALVKDGGGSLEARICSAEVVERISSEPRVLSQISSIGGLARGLVEMLHEMATPKAMKSALKALLAVCSISKIRMEAVSAGAVESLIDILIEKEKGADELCLSLLECLCRCAEGRAAVTGHALGIPVVVKKMTRSSPVATEFAVGVLWSVCSRSNDATMAARYAAESGLCSKLFWVLQTECSPKAKIKASDLIRFVHSACSDCPCCYTTSLLENAAVHQDDD